MSSPPTAHNKRAVVDKTKLKVSGLALQLNGRAVCVNFFDYIWFPWTEINQRKYGPNMCHGEGRCEIGLYGAQTAIQASTV